MAKKFQLTELKVTSFVTTLSESQQETAKGGFTKDRRIPSIQREIRQDWTEHKTRVNGFKGSAYSAPKSKRF